MELIISWIALGLSVISFATSIIIYLAGLRRARRQATLDAFNAFQCQVLDKLNFYTAAEVKGISKNNRSPENKEISALLARYEHFAVGVNQKIYDIKTVRRLAGEHIRNDYHKLLPLIKAKSKIGAGQNRYNEFETLALKLGYIVKDEI